MNPRRAISAVVAATLVGALLVFAGCSSSETGNEKGGTDSSARGIAQTLSEVAVGDVVDLGSIQFEAYYGGVFNDEVDWRVLAKEDDRALLISENILDIRPYFEDYEAYQSSIYQQNMSGELSVGNQEEFEQLLGATWERATIRTWLNNEFLDGMPSELSELIIPVEVANEANPVYGTYGGAATEDCVFLLSIDEANSFFSSDSERRAVYSLSPETYQVFEATYGFDLRDEFADGAQWWLRSPGYFWNYAAYVGEAGDIGDGEGWEAQASDGSTFAVPMDGVGGEFVGESGLVDVGVRPAMWVNCSGGSDESEAATRTQEEEPFGVDGGNAGSSSGDSAEHGMSVPEGAIEWMQTPQHLGETVDVYGPVVSTHFAADSTGRPTFFNIGASYPDTSGVTLVLWEEDSSAFQSSTLPVEGATVCVTGVPYLYEGECYIKLESPDQVTIL